MKLLKQRTSLETQRAKGRKPAVGLTVINDLLDRLHAEHIGYCHWKSNEHLQDAMEGDTDLDILVDRDKTAALSVILSQSGFKRFSAVPRHAYPAIEDYLALDGDTGKLVHLHLHYQLTLGEKHLKGYRLPWENLILSTRQLSEKENIYVANPTIEIILLLLRAALKIRTRDRLLSMLKTPYSQKDGLLKEFLWLKEQTEIESVFQTGRELLGEETANLITKLVSSQPSLRLLRTLRRSAKDTLRLHKTYGKIEGIFRRWARELSWMLGILNRRYFHVPVPFSRLAPQGGLVVALLGADGSGKSTITKEITRWLSRKIDVLPVYFGSGDGPSSMIRWPLLLALRSLKKSRFFKTGSLPVETPHEDCRVKPVCFFQTVKAWARIPWALALALEKRRKLHLTSRARNEGMIVICDRYPQCQVMDFSDGPLLSHWLEHPRRLQRALAKWEFSTYRRAEKLSPDLIIKLNVSPEIAAQRKPADFTMLHIVQRVEAIRSLRYQTVAKVEIINADEVFEQVLLRVKQAVWARI